MQLSQTVLYDYPRAGIWRDTLSFSFNKFGTGCTSLSSYHPPTHLPLYLLPT